MNTTKATTQEGSTINEIERIQIYFQTEDDDPVDSGYTATKNINKTR